MANDFDFFLKASRPDARGKRHCKVLVIGDEIGLLEEHATECNVSVTLGSVERKVWNSAVFHKWKAQVLVKSRIRESDRYRVVACSR